MKKYSWVFCANIFQTCFLLNKGEAYTATNWGGHMKLTFSSVPWFLFRCVCKLLFSSYMYIHECCLKALTFFYVCVCRLHYMSQYINKVLKQTESSTENSIFSFAGYISV